MSQHMLALIHSTQLHTMQLGFYRLHGASLAMHVSTGTTHCALLIVHRSLFEYTRRTFRATTAGQHQTTHTYQFLAVTTQYTYLRPVCINCSKQTTHKRLQLCCPLPSTACWPLHDDDGAFQPLCVCMSAPTNDRAAQTASLLVMQHKHHEYDSLQPDAARGATKATYAHNL